MRAVFGVPRRIFADHRAAWLPGESRAAQGPAGPQLTCDEDGGFSSAMRPKLRDGPPSHGEVPSSCGSRSVATAGEAIDDSVRVGSVRHDERVPGPVTDDYVATHRALTLQPADSCARSATGTQTEGKRDGSAEGARGQHHAPGPAASGSKTGPPAGRSWRSPQTRRA